MTQNPDRPDDIDGVDVAPEVHRILFQNGNVRVLDVSVPPKAREAIHTHEAGALMISLTTSDLVYENWKWEDGDWVMTSSDKRTTQKGKCRWIPCEGPHVVENLEDTVAQALRIEFLDQPGDMEADEIIEGEPVFFDVAT